MSKTILPSGEELNVTPDQVLRYMNPDGLRQLLRQEHLRWKLKVNRDVDYLDNTHLFKYSGELHNEAMYQRMELRTFSDNGAIPGYAGINIDSGLFGIPHKFGKWDETLSDESKATIINLLAIGATATTKGHTGYGINDDDEMDPDTENRAAALLMDPYDGRIYMLSNDDPAYVNNEKRNITSRLPKRTVARIGDIPTRITQLVNDLDFVSDPDYTHTDNNFTNSNRFILDNIDDRTFVYPEIAKDKNGEYIKNIRYGLDGTPGYGESDGKLKQNTHPDVYDNRGAEAINSYGVGAKFSGVSAVDGYLPGVFRSLEELEKVDIIGQRKPVANASNAGAKRPANYYIDDGKWSSNWINHVIYKDSYLAQSMNPFNMEVKIDGCEPVPYSSIDTSFTRDQLYQWRYNRIDIKYYSKDIKINIIESGHGYEVGDLLVWSFGDDSFKFKVTIVGPNGQIQAGEYIQEEENVYDQDPSTNGIGIEFSNLTSVGSGAKLAINAIATIETHATQIKNNLYAYVDITPTIGSDNNTPWSDTKLSDTQGGKIGVRSTAAGPAYSGINSGRGGESTSTETSDSILYEHGGNPTAGVHVHLFRYVIDTEHPTWQIKDGVQVFTGKWVDQGPMGLERPCDIKALLFSNADTNNFNNYYKFMLDLFFDSIKRNPDAVVSNNENAISTPYIHIDQIDPTPERKFYATMVNPDTSELEKVDVTSRVIYINGATGLMFVYNAGYKNDPTFGYGYRGPGWIPLSGAITK